MLKISTEDLAKQSQNPIASLVSVPFQSNSNFNAGRFNRTQEVFNIQPVVPMRLNEQWNVISRTIVPLIGQPDPLADRSSNGVGDITQSLFLSPVNSEKLIWGVGPVFTLPSASDPILGHREGAIWPHRGIADDTGTLGDRCAGQQSMVCRRQPVARFGQHVSRATLHQLQHGAWLVLDYVTDHHRQLARRVSTKGGLSRLVAVSAECSKSPSNRSTLQFKAITTPIRPNVSSDWQLRASVAFLFPDR